jgi:hypothetical protein
MATATQNIAPSHETLLTSESRFSDSEPRREHIALLAYTCWLDRAGMDEGSAEGDWFRAERELRAS